LIVTRPKTKVPQRGKALEFEVVELFRKCGFRAHHDSDAAKPRQTDIVAQGQGQALLIEVKDRKRAVDVGDIDSLRARLARTTPDVVGMIFTTSSITKGAIKEIESDRTREVIVFVSNEIELLRAATARLPNLIAKKRSELRLNGRAWFRTGDGGEYLNVALPKSSVDFTRDSNSTGYFCSATGFAHSAFSLDIPDTGWGIPGGEGVRLCLPLSLSTHDELHDLLGYLHDSFGLSSNGAFTIHQSGACWHGCGVRSFMVAAKDVWPRYRASPMTRVHHSEDLVYFDQLGNGWISLYLRQRVPDDDETGPVPYFFDTRLCIQMPGVPVDTAPYVGLCRYTGNEWADFRSVHERQTHTRRLKKPIELEVVGTAVRSYDDRARDRWVVGLIARNPFYRKKRLPLELEADDSTLHDLLQMELILCCLRDQIECGDEVDGYFLEGIETTEAEYAQIIRPFGTWNRLIKRVDGDPTGEKQALVGLTEVAAYRTESLKGRRRRRK
jgi:hypothetical protein